MRSDRGETTIWDVLIVLSMTGVLLILLYQGGYSDGKQDFQKEAANKGHAEYVVDKDGNPVWQWKEIGKCSLPKVEEEKP